MQKLSLKIRQQDVKLQDIKLQLRELSTLNLNAKKPVTERNTNNPRNYVE